MSAQDIFQEQRSPCYEINDPAPSLDVRSYDNLTKQIMGGVVGSLSNGLIIVSEEEAEAYSS
ncbi:hypothetical protein IFO70_04035 [Phormidium tenue FACHB-886]|nr:hypothetical protein [Phormidium tenue FACHB-886]